MSYPSNGPQPHNPVGEHQGDSHPFSYGFLLQTSVASLRGIIFGCAPLFLPFRPSPTKYSNPPARRRRARDRWQSREVWEILRMGTSSRCLLHGEGMELISSMGSRVPHVRIPGVTAILHTSTAVIFTSRLRGVSTCSLYIRVARMHGVT